MVNTNYEEVFDDTHDDGETNETWIHMIMGTVIFFKKDNEAECEISDNVGEKERVNDDMGENKDDEADVDTNLQIYSTKSNPGRSSTLC